MAKVHTRTFEWSFDAPPGALWPTLGDAAAYHLVHEQFAILAATFRAHNGSIIKKIGDTVLAAFSEPADPVRAALGDPGTIPRVQR